MPRPKANSTCNCAHKVEGFVAKLFKIVNDAGSNHLIEWGADHSHFIIHNEDKFIKEILVSDFKALIFQSFRRQLNNYGFFRQTAKEKPGQICYGHPWFQKDLPEELWRIERRTRKKPEDLSHVD